MLRLIHQITMLIFLFLYYREYGMHCTGTYLLQTVWHTVPVPNSVIPNNISNSNSLQRYQMTINSHRIVTELLLAVEMS